MFNESDPIGYNFDSFDLVETDEDILNTINRGTNAYMMPVSVQNNFGGTTPDEVTIEEDYTNDIE